MGVFGFWILAIIAVTAIVFVAMPAKRRQSKAAPTLLYVLNAARAHPVWVLFWLDIVLIAALSNWYGAATLDAPNHPVAGRIFVMPVPVGHSSARPHVTLFAPGYVDLTTLVIGWVLIVNTTLLLAAGIVGFFRGVWGPTRLTDDAPPPPDITSFE
jgi:hypothetical protein